MLVAGVLLTRGGGSKKNASSSVTTTTAKRRTSSSSSSATDSATDFATSGFHTVTETFDHGVVEVFVPDSWEDSFPVQLDNGEPLLLVAPDTTTFTDGTFTHPGVQIDAFGVDANGLNTTDNLDNLLANFLNQPPENDGVPGGPPVAVCTPAKRGNYPNDIGVTSDGGFSGPFESFTGCRGAGSVVVVFAASADNSFILRVVVQAVTPADQAAVSTILGSILVQNFP